MSLKRTSLAARRRRGARSSIGLVTLSCAIVCAAWLLRQKGADLEAKEQATSYVAQFDTVEVPVPAEQVPAGTRLNKIKFRNISYPRQQLPQGALLSLDGWSEAVSTSVLPANLPLFKENLSNTSAPSNPVIERIPPGMRAMTIRVDATSAVEGWAGSGAVVDVLLIEKNRTSVVAEKVKILSAERVVSAVEGAASPSVPSTVTLLVTQEQCLAINTAIPLGKIAFALRGGRDGDAWDRSVYTADNLKGASSEPRSGAINGYVSVKDKQGTKSFALNEGKWIETEVIPEGFLVATEK